MNQGRVRQVQTSLVLQVLLYFGGWWDVIFWIISLALFIYKGYTLPYPSNNFGVEFAFIWLYLLIEPVRIFLGSKGNLSETSGPLVYSVVLALPLIAFHVYYMGYQTYVLRLEKFVNAVSLSFCCAQVLMALLTALKVMRASRLA